jgi:alanine dehydrogenase
MKRQYSLGFISQSQLAKEMRSPLWYKHLTEENLKNSLIKEYIFEQYFGSHTFPESADDYLIELGCKVVDRFSLLNLSDIVISLKPTDEWEYMRSGSTLVGWLNHLKSLPKNLKKVNFLDLEDINIWAEGRQQKLLYRNAYVAGECGVAQTLEELRRLDSSSPAITEGKLAVVLGYGNIGRGATMELLRQGIEKIVVFTQRKPSEINDKLQAVEYRQMKYGYDNTYEVICEELKRPLIDGILARADIIVNAKIPSHCQPKWTFVAEDGFNKLKLNMAFIDPVHKAGHGASFTHITQLVEPLKLIWKSNHSIWYNGCNAMPSYRPAYASYMISQALLGNLDSLLEAVFNKKNFLL